LLQHVPEELKTLEMCIEAMLIVLEDDFYLRHHSILKYIPEELKPAVLDEVIIQENFFNI